MSLQVSYTHDRDFGRFREWPDGKKSQFHGRGWCPPRGKEYAAWPAVAVQWPCFEVRSQVVSLAVESTGQLMNLEGFGPYFRACGVLLLGVE